MCIYYICIYVCLCVYIYILLTISFLKFFQIVYAMFECSLNLLLHLVVISRNSSWSIYNPKNIYLIILEESLFSGHFLFAISLHQYQRSCQLLCLFKLLCMAKKLGRSFVTEHKGNNSPLLKWEIQTYQPVSNSCYNSIFA